jgi:hypothetical protein
VRPSFLPTKVAPIFGPRYVAKLVRSAAACGEMGTPQPHQASAWLLAIVRKLTATWHTGGVFNSLLDLNLHALALLGCLDNVEDLDRDGFFVALGARHVYLIDIDSVA